MRVPVAQRAAEVATGSLDRATLVGPGEITVSASTAAGASLTQLGMLGRAGARELFSTAGAVQRLAVQNAVPAPVHDTVVPLLRAMGA